MFSKSVQFLHILVNGDMKNEKPKTAFFRR